MKPTHPASWSEPSFARDSAIYALASLADAVVQRAMSGDVIPVRYRRWIENPSALPGEHTNGLALVRTGFSDASVTLYARRQANQFFVECEHEQFRSLVAVGAEAPDWGLKGVSLASFEGNEAVAYSFGLALARYVRGGDSGASSPAARAAADLS